MNILKKVQFYRRALQTLIALNVAVVTAGLIAGVSYFSSVQFLKVLTEQNVERMQQLQGMQNDLAALTSDEKKAVNQRIRHLESLRIRLENWPGTSLAQISLPENFDGTTLAPELVHSVRERITKEEKNLGDQLVDASKKLGSLAQQLMVLAFFTILFGVILPIFLFRKLTIEIQNAKVKVEEKVTKSIASWLETHSQHGEKPFQDPLFWLKIILLSVEAIAPGSRHPIVQFVGDFAPSLRTEIEKQRQNRPEKSSGGQESSTEVTPIQRKST